MSTPISASRPTKRVVTGSAVGLGEVGGEAVVGAGVSPSCPTLAPRPSIARPPAGQAGLLSGSGQGAERAEDRLLSR